MFVKRLRFSIQADVTEMDLFPVEYYFFFLIYVDCVVRSPFRSIFSFTSPCWINESKVYTEALPNSQESNKSNRAHQTKRNLNIKFDTISQHIDLIHINHHTFVSSTPCFIHPTRFDGHNRTAYIKLAFTLLSFTITPFSIESNLSRHRLGCRV